MVGDPKWEAEDGAIYAVVTVGRFLIRDDGTAVQTDTAVGAKREALQKWSQKGGKFFEDPFAFEKAISKAERNAKLKLLSETIKDEILALAISQGRVQRPVPEAEARPDRQATRGASPKKAADQGPGAARGQPSRRPVDQGPPAQGGTPEDKARALFYTRAANLGLTAAEALHDNLGLDCGGKGHGAQDANGCRAIRGEVHRLMEAGSTEAGAWEILTAKLTEPSLEDTLADIFGDEQRDE